MRSNNSLKSYNELITLTTYDERLAYLKTYGKIGEDTFGFERYLNQRFYRSSEWKRIRKQIFLRDNGCDMGLEGYDIIDPNSVIIHHINPLSISNFSEKDYPLIDPNNLITVSRWTHNLIHFGDENKVSITFDRSPNDTCPWKR